MSTTSQSAAYLDLLEQYVQLPGSETLTEDNLAHRRPLSREDYLDIFDHVEDSAGQIELPRQAVRDLLAAQTDEQRSIARILIATEIMKQLQKDLRARLYLDVCEAVEDEQVNAHFVGVM